VQAGAVQAGLRRVVGELPYECRAVLPAATAARTHAGLFAHLRDVPMTRVDGTFDVFVGHGAAETDVHGDSSHSVGNGSNSK
jgi:hypothetical protein